MKEKRAKELKKKKRKRKRKRKREKAIDAILYFIQNKHMIIIIYIISVFTG